MTGTAGMPVQRQQARGAGWWIRSALMVLVPLGIVWLGRELPPLVLIGTWLVAQLGAVFVFHPDTIGWRIGGHRSWVGDGRSGQPSERWRVTARLYGLFVLVACVVGVLATRP